jgi:hypothetical protein
MKDVPAIPGHVSDEGVRLLGIENYAYGANSPIAFSDPTGESLLVAAGITVTLAAVGGGLYLFETLVITRSRRWRPRRFAPQGSRARPGHGGIGKPILRRTRGGSVSLSGTGVLMP